MVRNSPRFFILQKLQITTDLMGHVAYMRTLHCTFYLYNVSPIYCKCLAMAMKGAKATGCIALFKTLRYDTIQ